MIQHRTLIVCIGALALAGPAAAATTPAAGPGANSRAPWLERYQEARQGPEQTERFNETFKVPGDGALDLSHVSGDVTVTTGRNGEIRVEAIKRVRHRDADEARRLLALLRVEVTPVGNRIEVRTIYPRTTSRNLSAEVDYTIVVPVGATVSVKTVSGDVSVNGVRGEVRAEAVSGDVDVVATPSLALAKTVSGDVRARDIGGADALTLGTVSGTVTATALKVRMLDAGTVSGDLHLSNLQVERLVAKTVTGGIDYDGNIARGGRYEFSAHSGGVRLVLANVSGFELDASTFNGTIRSDFPVTLHSTSRDTGARGRRPVSTRAIRGTFGDAGALLSIRSFSGSVVITKK